MDKNKQLTVEVKDGELSITIGVEVLAPALLYGLNYDRTEDARDFIKITDPNKFAEGVVDALKDEWEEDGVTLVHKMLNSAANLAVENATEAIVFPNEGGNKVPVDRT